MKKWIISCALVAAASAMAGNTEAGTAKHRTSTEPAADRLEKDLKEGVNTLGSETKEAVNKVGVATESQGTFKAEKAYDISGMAKRASAGKLTLERTGLPPATLDVRDETKVTFNGQKVNVGAIPEGAMVRAKFQLEGNATVAVEVTANGRDPGKKSEIVNPAGSAK